MRRTVWVALMVIGACSQKSGPARAVPDEPGDRAQERLHMVSKQIESRGVRDPHVLRAMRAVPRHRFVPTSQQDAAYDDSPLPIGHRQTISQPYIVALMSELAGVKPGGTVLEVGTGSGYQAAVLAEMGVKVFSIEIVEPLAKRARATLTELGYRDVKVRHGDGYAGWPEHAPFDAIVVTAAPPKIPKPLKDQLKIGGRLVIPVGKYFQELVVVTRTKDGFREKSVLPVRFVPMTGKAQRK
jgi:protein-L-isoaspartate(D-aspartate) O-methyltransferase